MNMYRKHVKSENVVQSRDPLLKISVITVVLNGVEHIRNTVESVLGQTYANIEYVVVDGGSTDGTLTVLQYYSDRISRLISEPDAGISDAMNKAISLCTGQYVIFIHADDYLVDSRALEEAVSIMSDEADIYCFDVEFQTKNGFEIKKTQPVSFWTNFKGQFCHQGMLCRAQLFEEVGGFETEYRIKMDYDFFLRCYKSAKSIKVVRKTLACMRDGGISSRRDLMTVSRMMEEEKRIHFKNCNSRCLKLVYRLWWSLYPKYKLRKISAT